MSKGRDSNEGPSWQSLLNNEKEILASEKRLTQIENSAATVRKRVSDLEDTTRTTANGLSFEKMQKLASSHGDDSAKLRAFIKWSTIDGLTRRKYLPGLLKHLDLGKIYDEDQEILEQQFLGGGVLGRNPQCLLLFTKMLSSRLQASKTPVVAATNQEKTGNNQSNSNHLSASRTKLARPRPRMDTTSSDSDISMSNTVSVVPRSRKDKATSRSESDSSGSSAKAVVPRKVTTTRKPATSGTSRGPVPETATITSEIGTTRRRKASSSSSLASKQDSHSTASGIKNISAEPQKLSTAPSGPPRNMKTRRTIQMPKYLREYEISSDSESESDEGLPPLIKPTGPNLIPNIPGRCPVNDQTRAENSRQGDTSFPDRATNLSAVSGSCVTSVTGSIGSNITKKPVNTESPVPCLIYNDKDSLYSFNWKTKAVQKLYDIVPRSWSSMVVVNKDLYVVGGSSAKGATFENKAPGSKLVDIFGLGSTKYRRSGPFLPHPLKERGTCVIGDTLYAIGGCMTESQGRQGGRNTHSVATNFCEMLKFRENQPSWIQFEDLKRDMVIPRGAHCMLTVGEKIYAIGGIGEKAEYLKSLEYYDTTRPDDDWTQVASMKYGRARFGAAVIGEHIYAIGGQGNQSQALKIVEKYDITQERWVEVMPMRHARRDHCVCIVGGRIYAIGGNQGQASMEAFDPNTGKWELLQWEKNLHATGTFYNAVTAFM